MAAITGTRKAALLLMSLDPAMASQLLSVVKAETATEIATEMAYLNACGGRAIEADSHDIIQEFCTLLSGSDSDWGLGFVKQMLESALGSDRSASAFEEVKVKLDYKDPFAAIRGANLYQIAAALEGEPPQVMSLVLAELPAKQSSELLGLLEDKDRNAAIQGMAGATNVSVEAKVRVAKVIKERLAALRAGGAAGTEGNAKEQQIRKVSVLLRGLPKETRDGMLNAIREQDPDTCQLVMKMMVTWDDMPLIGERALQECLRACDLRKLALAMVNADTRVTDRIKMNMSESARNMLYEESLLISAPKQRAIDEAREGMLSDLRELNEAGMLEFEAE